MKKIVLLMIICLCVNIAKADEPFWVTHITSKDSIVWVEINIPSIIYKISFNGSGKICWEEEQDYALYADIMSEHVDFSVYDTYYDKKNNRLWELRNGFVYFQENNDWEEVFYIPNFVSSTAGLSRSHVSENGDIWLGGYGFIGYYQNGVFTRIFLIDYLQSTIIYLCTEDRACPEEKEEEKEPKEEDFEKMEDFETAWSAWSSPPPDRDLCFCDGRKIGYIDDDDGFVNFRTEPNLSAPIIGIILNNVSIFYWDNGNSDDWYQVEINEMEGYVHKSGIKQEKNNELYE